MPFYRLYFYSPQGRIALSRDTEKADDACAITYTSVLLGHSLEALPVAEVWELTRMVARLDKEAVLSIGILPRDTQEEAVNTEIRICESIKLLANSYAVLQKTNSLITDLDMEWMRPGNFPHGQHQFPKHDKI